MFLDLNRFIKSFNLLYSRSTPFIFITDFNIEKFYIEKLELLENRSDILYNFNGIKNYNSPFPLTKTPTLNKSPIPPTLYKERFEKVFEHLVNGDSYLLNLTFPTKINIDLNFQEILFSANAPYKLKFFDDFIFFSPESFIKIEDGIISTYPMKGTKYYKSEQSIKELLEDPKEIAEHITVVDLLRNDLNMVANDVKVEDFRYISFINLKGDKLIQTSTKIVGKLKNKDIAENILKLLPAGSVTGAPKKKTVEIIKENELDARGFYTGIAGLFDGKKLDSCVIIRYIEKRDVNLYFRSGGGITIYSDWKSEYKEMVDKVYVPIL
ncbi:MAG: aminodeoxychorismate synthase component I [Deferribacterales bacterium]